MLTNFPAKKAVNLGGYRSFMFVPYQNILSFPMIANGSMVVPVELYPSAAWLQGYATAETLTYTEDTQNEGNGVYYTLTIAGFVPGDRAELIQLMTDMEQQRFVGLIKDIGNYKRLVGSPAAPLDFMATFNSGQGRADSKGFSFKFTGESLFRAPVYSW